MVCLPVLQNKNKREDIKMVKKTKIWFNMNIDEEKWEFVFGSRKPKPKIATSPSPTFQSLENQGGPQQNKNWKIMEEIKW